MTKNDFIITNVLIVKGFNKVIKNDLLPYWINQKYNILFANKENAKTTFNTKTLQWEDGFDVGFSMLAMR